MFGASTLALLSTAGCPAFLADDFRKIPARKVDDGITGSALDAGDETNRTDSSAAGGANNSGGGAGDGGSGAGGSAASGGGASAGGNVPDGGVSGGATGAGGAGVDAGLCAPCGSLAACCPPHWAPMVPAPLALVPREKAASASLGTRAFLWGGADGAGVERDDGAIYDAESDSWEVIPGGAGAPSPRVLATAVWTGTVVVVWGGGDAAGLSDVATGSRYDPAARAWRTIATAGAPAARRAPYGLWTGSRALFYGGVSATGLPQSGAFLYDPVGDTWTAASVTDEPVAPLNPTVGFTGSSLLVYGGRSAGTSYTGRMDAYDPVADLWTRRPAGPQARAGAFGGWDGAALVAWGGTAQLVKKDGQRYSLARNAWTNMSNESPPSPRFAVHRETGWSARIADSTTCMIGGYDAAQTPLTDGAYYDSTANVWTPVAAWPSGSAHLFGAGVWAGSRFVLWGGRPQKLAAPTAAGELFVP